jgi:polyisoprenoid-binding protein YceI
MRHDPSSPHDGRRKTLVDHSLRTLTGRSTAAWATRPARTILAASLLISLTLPFAGTAPSTAEAASSPSSPGLAAVAMDEAPPADPGAGDPAAATDPAAAPSAPTDGLVHLGLIPGENEVRFVMRLRTIGQPTRAAACATRAVTGQIVLTQDAAVVSEMSKMVVDMKTLKCAPPLRDTMAQQLLETQKYPTAEFMFEQAPGLTVPLPMGDANLKFIGQQTVHGVTRPAEYTTAATFGPTDVTGHATTDHNMSTFGLKPPSIPPLIQVEDGMTVEFDFHANITGA